MAAGGKLITESRQTPTGAAGEPRRRSTVRIRTYLAGLVLLFVVAAGAATVYGRSQAREDARNSAHEDAQFGARLAAREIAQGIATLQSTVAATATNPAVAKTYGRPRDCSLKFGGTGAFATGHIDLVRTDGSVACSSLRSVQTGYQRASWRQRALRSPLVLAPTRDARTGKQVVLTSAPVPKLGAVVAAYYLDGLGPGLAATLGGPRRLEFLVTDPRSRTALSRSIDSSRWVGAPLAGTPFARDDGTERRDVDGKQRLYGSATVPGTGWRVYAGADRAQALAANGRLDRRELTIILLGLALFILAAAVVYRRISRPIERLSAAVQDAPADGGAARVEVSGPTEVVTLGERFNGLIGAVGRELGERRRAEEHARASARAYRVLFEGSPLPMWVQDAGTGRFLEVNEAAVAQYGYTREQLLAMTVDDLVPAEQPAADQVIHVRRDGTPIEVEVSSHEIPFRDHDARFVIAADVTEKERLRRQLQQSQRLESIGQLAGGIAHDFNNLLAVILGYASFAEETVAGAARGDGGERLEPLQRDIEEIRKAGERAARLTHQLLAFARREVVEPKVLDLTGVVIEMEQLLRRTLGEHVKLQTSLAPDLWPIMADYGQLEQVLVNLAVNARDAMPQGGILTLDTENTLVDESYAASRPELATGRYVRLRVSDTGTGMGREVIARAFEPFFTTKPKGEGSGLGLATVYGIVTQGGGHVQIYSEPSIGTTVTVLLPATDVPVPEPAHEGTARGGGGETILVVEDEHAMLEVTRRLLTRNDYRVLAAGDGAEAVRLAAEHEGDIDLLLTDVVMPQMLGREVAERVSRLRPRIPVLYMSGYAQAIIGPMGELSSGTRIIDKPFTEAELLERIREALDTADSLRRE